MDIDLIPVIINGRTTVETKKKNIKHKHKERVQHDQQQKVVIIGDSHARGYAANMKYYLTNNYKVSGIVKPGACADTLIASAPDDIEHLTNKDAIIFWGGTNDVGKNNSQAGLRHIVEFVEANCHTNIILVSAPHRYDLSDWSCVNNEVKSFNRKLSKLMKPFQHVTVTKVDFKREYFTRHGLHMNRVGKEKTSLKTAKAVYTMLHKQTRESIRLHWKTECEDRTSHTTSGDNIIMQEDATTENGEGIYHATDQGALLEELGGTENHTAYEEAADVQGNEPVKNSADSFSNCVERQEVRTSTRTRKPPLKLTNHTAHEEAAYVQGNEPVKNSADSFSNCVERQEVRTSTRKRKPPLKLSKDFL
jgi:hypothetical protein